ncbi:MAG: serine/threonine protein kinase [Planctomycetaceae bacterium]|nr:serine/threonine protein kinase [Planctomycetaceae bacterium]
MVPEPEDTTFHLIGMPRVSDEKGLRSREPFEVLATQYVDELRKGLRPSVELYARRFPPHADRIREYFPVLNILEQARVENEAGVFRRTMPEKFPFKRLGGYELHCEIGRGGMGVIFQAKDTQTQQIIAVKLLPWRTSVVPEWMKKFQREAHIASQIHHPGIVPVYQCGEEWGYVYYSMQFIYGVGLDRLITRLQHTRSVSIRDEIELMNRARPTGFQPELHANHPVEQLPQSRRQLSRESWIGFADIATRTAGALQAAHAAGILHNDIKPGNLLVDGTGHVWVTDFGLSQPFDPVSIAGSIASNSDGGKSAGILSKQQAIQLYGIRNRPVRNMDEDHEQRMAGTLRYMSPERLMGKPADVRSDIYALGMTLYELSLQLPPFAAVGRDRLLACILDESPQPPREIRKELPKDLESIILRCIARDPDERYQSAEALHNDLMRFIAGQPLAASRTSRVGNMIRNVQSRLSDRNP